MRVVVIGATGRTGGEIVAEATERGHDVVGVARSAGEVGDVPVHPAGELPALLADADTDAIIDFTLPEASREYAARAAEAGVPYVVGTTGFDDDGLAALDAAAESTAVLKASNFARGVQALLQVVKAGVAALPEYDVELTETHHDGKRDAPSGTAKTILAEIGETTDLEEVYGREGLHPREDGEVGVHVRRAGNVRGEHEVMFAGNDEVLTLTHRAESRAVFAAGALDAAVWAADRDPGSYDFGDVIDT